MARAIWSGSINFGLVTIPVKLMTAVRDRQIHFNLLHDEDMGRVHNERVCDQCGKKLDWHDVVRGYAVEKDHYVVVTDEDLKKANPEAPQSVDIVAFASLDEIDPIFYDTPYYLEPEKRGRHAYALLREALKKSNRVGIARVVIRIKEHLAALKPQGDALVLELMHWADEVVSPNDLQLPPSQGKDAEPRAPEMKAALMLIDGMTQKFDPESFHDRYREEILEMVHQRAEGHAPAEHAVPRATATDLVDLAEVLQRSLEAHGNGGKTKAANDAHHGRTSSRVAQAGAGAGPRPVPVPMPTKKVQKAARKRASPAGQTATTKRGSAKSTSPRRRSA